MSSGCFDGHFGYLSICELKVFKFGSVLWKKCSIARVLYKSFHTSRSIYCWLPRRLGNGACWHWSVDTIVCDEMWLKGD